MGDMCHVYDNHPNGHPREMVRPVISGRRKGWEIANAPSTMHVKTGRLLQDYRQTTLSRMNDLPLKKKQLFKELYGDNCVAQMDMGKPCDEWYTSPMDKTEVMTQLKELEQDTCDTMTCGLEKHIKEVALSSWLLEGTSCQKGVLENEKSFYGDLSHGLKINYKNYCRDSLVPLYEDRAQSMCSTGISNECEQAQHELCAIKIGAKWKCGNEFRNGRLVQTFWDDQYIPSDARCSTIDSACLAYVAVKQSKECNESFNEWKNFKCYEKV